MREATAPKFTPSREARTYVRSSPSALCMNHAARAVDERLNGVRIAGPERDEPPCPSTRLGTVAELFEHVGEAFAQGGDRSTDLDRAFDGERGNASFGGRRELGDEPK